MKRVVGLRARLRLFLVADLDLSGAHRRWRRYDAPADVELDELIVRDRRDGQYLAIRARITEPIRGDVRRRRFRELAAGDLNGLIVRADAKRGIVAARHLERVERPGASAGTRLNSARIRADRDIPSAAEIELRRVSEVAHRPVHLDMKRASLRARVDDDVGLVDDFELADV